MANNNIKGVSYIYKYIELGSTFYLYAKYLKEITSGEATYFQNI